MKVVPGVTRNVAAEDAFGHSRTTEEGRKGEREREREEKRVMKENGEEVAKETRSNRPCGRTVLITTRPPIFFELKGAEVFARGNGG